MDVIELGKIKIEEAKRIEVLIKEIEEKQRTLKILLYGSNIELVEEDKPVTAVEIPQVEEKPEKKKLAKEEVAKMMDDGMSYQQIADFYQVKYATVNNFISRNILAKKQYKSKFNPRCSSH